MKEKFCALQAALNAAFADNEEPLILGSDPNTNVFLAKGESDRRPSTGKRRPSSARRSSRSGRQASVP